MKSIKIDLIDYLFEIPYTVSVNDQVAVIDMINHPKIVSKQLWEKIIGDDIKVLYTIMAYQTDNEKVLESIVNYYFTDKILRKISLIPEYINYDKLSERTVPGDMISSDVWRIHLQYLYDLRTLSRVTLNNHRISTTKLMNKIKRARMDVDERAFSEKIKDLILNHPKIITSILMYVSQEKLIKAGGKSEFIRTVQKTEKDLKQKLINFKYDSKLTTANREAVKYVHSEMNYELEEFKIIEHIVDYITLSSIINSTVYKPVYQIIVKLISSLEKIEKSI